MTAVTSTLGSFLDALKAQLVARGDLAGVNILTAPADREIKGLEFILLAADQVELDVTWPRAGGKIDEEEYTIPCVIQVFGPGASDATGDETAAQTVRNRALTLLSTVANTVGLDWRMSSTVEDSECRGGTVKQGIGDSGQRVCEVKFDIWARATLVQS